MGRRYNEVTEEIKQVPYKVQGAGNGDVRISAGGKEWSPPEISAIILQKMKQSAEDYLGRRSTRPLSPFLLTSTTRNVRPPKTPARSPVSK